MGLLKQATDMYVNAERVRSERSWLLERAERIVAIINDVRNDLAAVFDLEVAPVEAAAYRQEVRTVFADGDLAVNVAGLVALLRELDVENDYPGFVVDELLGRELAATIAEGQPLRTLGEATFHYADIHLHGEAGDPAGLDDLEAALAAGFQERLPGWAWTERDSPFSVPREE